MKKFLLLIFVAILVIIGCGHIAINTNNYRFLTQNNKEKICTGQNYGEDCKLVEVDGQSMKQLLAKSKTYNLISIWYPSCTKSLNYINNILTKYGDTDFKIWLISSQFYIDDILKAKDKYGYNEPVYIMHHKYGNNASNVETKFIYDLCHVKIKSNSLYKNAPDYYVFYGDSLITIGYEQSFKLLDSLNRK